jgi:uracil-DNA glycosylase
LERTFPGYPEGLVYEKPFEGIAFFPGGPGVYWDCDETKSHDIPAGGIMIVGNDFGHPLPERARQSCKGESGGPTWRPLLEILRSGGIDPGECFFTNAYMGLRDGGKQEGCSPGMADAEFVARCQRFFLDQLKIQQPGLVIALGTYVPPFLAKLAPDSLKAWDGDDLSRGVLFSKIDQSPIIHDVMFPGVLECRPTVVSLLHPSKRHLNLRHRKYKKLQAHEAEVGLLREAHAHVMAKK